MIPLDQANELIGISNIVYLLPAGEIRLKRSSPKWGMIMKVK